MKERIASPHPICCSFCGRGQDEFARLRVGQGFEEDGVDDAEDGGVGADAEGEEQDDERAEQRMRAQPAEGGQEDIHGVGRCGRVQDAPRKRRRGGGLSSSSRRLT